MFRRSLLRVSVIVAGLGLAASMFAMGASQDRPRRGRKYKAPPPTSRIEITVVRYDDGKPVKNAAVVFHAIQGEKDKGYMELKTNDDGKAVIDVLPIGDVMRLPVISKDFQTFGQDYKVEKPQMAVEVKLMRPGEQYSIYKNHDKTANAAPGSGSKQPAQPSKDAGKSSDKPSGEAKQPDAQAGSEESSSQPK